MGVSKSGPSEDVCSWETPMYQLYDAPLDLDSPSDKFCADRGALFSPALW